MADVKMPRTFKVSGKAAEAARAARDPNLHAPASARTNTDKSGVEYKRWVETGSIEFSYREATADGSQVVYILGVKMRPGEPNQNKIGWFRMKIHPDIAEGREVSPEVESKFEWLTNRSLVALISLIDVTGFTPKKEGAEIGSGILEALFPLKAQKTKGPIIGKMIAVKIVQKKNTPPYDKERPYQEDVELFLPPAPITGTSA